MMDVFISYSRDDEGAANFLYSELVKAGLEVFIDTKRLVPGKPYDTAIDQAVKSAKVVIGLWTPKSLTREWVRAECMVGLDRGVLIPLELAPLAQNDTPTQFYNLDRIRFFSATGGYEEGWVKLMWQLASRLVKPELANRAATRYKTIRALCLDDAPGIVEGNLKTVMRSLEASSEAFPTSNEALRIGGFDNCYLCPSGMGERVRMIFTFGGLRKVPMLQALDDSLFLSHFQLAFIDLTWNELSPGFKASDFGPFAPDFAQLGGTDRAGFLLAKIIRKNSTHNPIIAIQSNGDPEAKKITQTWEVGAVSFIRKSDVTDWSNILIPALRCAKPTHQSHDRRASFLRHLYQSGFEEHAPERRMLDSLAFVYPHPISLADLRVAAGGDDPSTTDDFARRLDKVKQFLASGGFPMEISGDIVEFGID
jgi:TIR domain